MVNHFFRLLQRGKRSTVFLVLLSLLFAGGAFLRPMWAQFPTSPPPERSMMAAPPAAPAEVSFKYFGFLHDPHFSDLERGMLFASLIIAVCALLYAWMLVKQVVNADQGTEKMKAICAWRRRR